MQSSYIKLGLVALKTLQVNLTVTEPAKLSQKQNLCTRRPGHSHVSFLCQLVTSSINLSCPLLVYDNTYWQNDRPLSETQALAT